MTNQVKKKSGSGSGIVIIILIIVVAGVLASNFVGPEKGWIQKLTKKPPKEKKVEEPAPVPVPEKPKPEEPEKKVTQEIKETEPESSYCRC